MPLAGGSAPTPEQFTGFLRFVEHQRAVGHPVAVHCVAGRGRTGTVLAGYLISRGYTFDDAIARVRSLQPRAIEAPKQMNFLRRLSGRWEPQPATKHLR
jgi:protein-tyrosine phosphatase